jgi:hypothetical protein
MLGGADMAKKLCTSIFIERSRLLYGDKYDYSEVNYINNRSKVKIICPKHGVFLTWPSAFLQGHGCNKCSHTKYKNNKDFIDKSKLIHGDKYDYSKLNYINYNKKVKIICPKHGVF